MNKKRGKKKGKKALWIGLAITVVCLVAALIALIPTVMKQFYPLKYQDLVEQYAQEYQLDKGLVNSVIWTESKFDEQAVSNKGAYGLMQIMPDTGKWIAQKLGLEEFDTDMLTQPEINIQLGCWYLNYLNERFDGNVTCVLASYNAGPNKVAEWLNDSRYSSDGVNLTNIPYPETQRYVEKVMSAYDTYQKLYEMP